MPEARGTETTPRAVAVAVGGRRRRKPGEGSAEGVEAGDESEPEAADGATGDSADDDRGVGLDPTPPASAPHRG